MSPELFPLTARITSMNELEIGGCSVPGLAHKFGTPLYVYDETTIREQAADALASFRARWDDVVVLYATKAYFAPFLARIFKGLGLGLDVTSEGEIAIARGAGFDPNLIYVHGNNKTPDEICAALNAGITHFIADSVDEIERLATLAARYAPRVRLPVLLRLAPNIDAHTHRYMTTGVADSKFGLGIKNGMAENAVRKVMEYPNLNPVGLHFHIGSQVFDTEALHDALQAVLDVAAAWHAIYGFQLAELNIGGGWGVAYNRAQTTLDVKSFAERTTRSLREGLRARDLNENLKLVVEPGRGLIARAGVAVYRVGSVKEIPGVRSYVAIDGGMGDNVRPALYGAQYSAFLGNRMNDAPTHKYAVAGRYCEQGDVLVESAALPETKEGDLLVIPVAGAYQLPLASNYNLIPRPAVVLVKDGIARLVRRRETLEDMLACEME